MISFMEPPMDASCPGLVPGMMRFYLVEHGPGVAFPPIYVDIDELLVRAVAPSNRLALILSEAEPFLRAAREVWS